VHSRHSEVFGFHEVSKFGNSLFGVAIDQGLIDIEVRVEIKEDVNLPFFSVDSNIVLLDTFKGKIFLFDKNSNRVPHEMFSHLKDIFGESSGEKTNLDLRW
jgi:hypothetical protein